MPLETDQSNGFKLALRDELRTGLHLSQFARSVPLWGDGQNVQFTPLGVQKLPGWESIVSTGGGPIRGILQREQDANSIAFAGDLSQLYEINLTLGTSTVRGTGYNLIEATGGSVWDGGATTWDGGDTIWDTGKITADHWSIINYGSFVFATSGAEGDKPQVRKDRDFVDMPGGVTGLTITNAGSGYVVGETLTMTGGSGSGATAEVIDIGPGGAIERVTMTNSGSYTAAPTGFTTSGSGTGATFAYHLCNMDVTSVKIFVNRGPHILGFNTSNSDREFIWCDAGDTDTWVTDANNLAGALTIRELSSEIKAAVPMGSRIAVYGDDQMFLVTYLGNDLVFGYQPALNGVGAVSSKAVVPVGSKNYGLSQQGFFVTDGSSYQYIDNPDVRRWYFDNVASGQTSKAHGFHDEENTQVRWYFPTNSLGITEGLAYNYNLGVWTRVIANRTSGQERVTASHPVTGDSSGNIYLEGKGDNAGSAAMVAWVRSKPIDLGDADLVKELDSIRIGYEGVGLQYRIGWSETETGVINWGPYQAMEQGFGFHNLRTAGRWLHIELYSNTFNTEWEVMNIEFMGRSEGTR